MLSIHTETPNRVPDDVPMQWLIQICGLLLTWEGRTQIKHCVISFHKPWKEWRWGEKVKSTEKEDQESFLQEYFELSILCPSSV